MENRRQYYRHLFTPGRRLRVQLGLPGSGARYNGEVIDLSIGGMRVRLKDAIQPVPGDDQLLAEISRKSGAEVEFQLGLTADIVHSEAHADTRDYGIRFLPVQNAAASETRERAIWRFLIQEQRRTRLAMRDEDATLAS